MELKPTAASAYSAGGLLTPKNIVVGLKLVNMVSRPTITMSNNQIPEDTRKYAATREFFTELFGVVTTLTVGSFIEKAGGQYFAKKHLGRKLEKKEFENIVKNAANSISDIKIQKTRNGILLSSFIGAAFAGGILTPVLNNILLNPIMSRTFNRKHKNNTSEAAVSLNNQENIFKNPPPSIQIFS
jgi:hypothetical protein